MGNVATVPHCVSVGSPFRFCVETQTAVTLQDACFLNNCILMMVLPAMGSRNCFCVGITTGSALISNKSILGTGGTLGIHYLVAVTRSGIVGVTGLGFGAGFAGADVIAVHGAGMGNRCPEAPVVNVLRRFGIFQLR